MAEFMGVHELPEGFDEQKMRDGWGKYKAAAVKLGLRLLRVHFNLKRRMAYCETEAGSADEILAAHKSAEIPLKEVIEVETVM